MRAAGYVFLEAQRITSFYWYQSLGRHGDLEPPTRLGQVGPHGVPSERNTLAFIGRGASQRPYRWCPSVQACDADLQCLRRS